MEKVSIFRKVFIWFLFIYATLTFLDCFVFLEFWYSKNEGLKNGFIFWDTSYSIFYWFSHVSYISSMLMAIWTGTELLGLYYPKYRMRTVWKYYVLLFSSFTMCFGGWYMITVVHGSIDNMFDSIAEGKWFGMEGAIYWFMNWSQFLSIHSILPMLCITYGVMYRKNDVTKKDIVRSQIFVAAAITGWYVYCGIGTLFGMQSPYVIIDWTPNDGASKTDPFPIAYQMYIWLLCYAFVPLTGMIILICYNVNPERRGYSKKTIKLLDDVLISLKTNNN